MVPLFFLSYRIFAFALAAIGGGLSVLLFFVGQSQEATVFAVAALLISEAPMLDLMARDRESRLLSLAAVAALAGWAVMTVWLFIRAPDGRPTAATARVQNRYLDGGWGYPRAALGNLLPELDQCLLGFQIMPALDPLLTRRQAGPLAEVTSAIYRELEADPDFHALGSVLPHAYDGLWLGRAEHGHYFLYTPKNLDPQKPAPVLVFLHGSSGNFKSYPWLLSKVAEECGMVLIAPTYGWGDWQEPATSKLIQATLKDAARHVRLDPKQQHLIGLSNGGRGLCQVGSEVGEQFQSLTFLSPVMDLEALTTQKFARRWKGRPIYILTGAADERVPLDYVTTAADQLRKRGAQVTLETVPGADHFLLFTQRDLVLPKITSWLKNLPASAPAPAAPPAEPDQSL